MDPLFSQKDRPGALRRVGLGRSPEEGKGEEMKKYKLLQNKNPQNLHQIQAIRNIPGICTTGDLGGWIESEANLSQDGNAWVSGNAWVYGNARVSGNAWVYGNARVSGNARVYGNAWVYGNARVSGNAGVSGNAWEKSPLYIQGTRNSITTSSHTLISIGCETHTVTEWLKQYKAIGRLHGYSKSEIEEYGRHLQYTSAWLKKMFPGKKTVKK